MKSSKFTTHWTCVPLIGTMGLVLLTLMTTSVAAQTLDTCSNLGGSGDQCDCATGPSGYDDCDMEWLVDLVGPDNATTLHSAASISTEWVGNDLHVYSDLTNLDVAVMTIPSNDGDWESVSELNSYLSDLFDTTVDVSDSNLRIVYNQEGSLARWNQSSNDWASNQLSGNLLWASITDANGRLIIDNDEMILQIFADCDTETDVDFSGTQCTDVEKWEFDICEGICGINGNVHDFIYSVVYSVSSTLTDFELSTGPYLRYDANWDTDTFKWRFRRMQVLADEADMLNLYYDFGGNFELSSPDHPSPEFDTDSTKSMHTGDDIRGGCGFGDAQRAMRRIEPRTTEGSAPDILTCEGDLP